MASMREAGSAAASTALEVTPRVWVASLVTPRANSPAPLRQVFVGPVPRIEC